ncbi:hypothetical protein HDZ31DRAFT_85000 [Schizophyllum fasciatum]
MEFYPGEGQDNDNDEYEASKRELDARFYDTFPGARVYLERIGVIKSAGVMNATHLHQYMEELQITARVHAPLPSTPDSTFDAIFGFSHYNDVDASYDGAYGPAASACPAYNSEAEQTSSGYQPASQFGDSHSAGYGQGMEYPSSGWYHDAAQGDQSAFVAVAADYAQPMAQGAVVSPQAYAEYVPSSSPITPTAPMSAMPPAHIDHFPHMAHPPVAPVIDTSHDTLSMPAEASSSYQHSSPRTYQDLSPTPAREAAAAAAAVARGRRHHTLQNRRGRVSLPPLEKPPASGVEKPPLACLFCRGRKIACGAPAAGSNTCNQCARRGLTCVYPTENRRGTRTRQPTRRSPQPRGRKRDAPPPAPGVEGMQIYEPDSMWPSRESDEDEDEDRDEELDTSGLQPRAGVVCVC